MSPRLAGYEKGMVTNMKIQLPEKVNFIIQTLENAGYEAYAVGGCVRDSLLGREPDDWDITTSANPYQVKEQFRRTIDTGIQHGTVTVMIDKEGFEVTTYRIDGEYEDSRHPKEVIFTKNLVEDLKRRDFTINAMAYNERSGIVDEFGGIQDLKNKMIRCVGKATERFTEDALRIMRAVRFSAQLGYNIEESTKAAIVELAPNLKNISAERVQTELVKLVVSPHPDYLRVAYDLGVTKVILPELDECFETTQNNPHHTYTVGEHQMQTMLHIRNDKALRLAALLHDIAKPLRKETDENGIDHFHGHPSTGEEVSEKILRRLKFDNDTITKVKKYVRFHDYPVEATSKSVRRAMNKIGKEYFPQILEIKYADTLAQSSYMKEEKLEHISKVESIYKEIIEKEQCVCIKDLKISGNDLMKMGIPQGKIIGEILNSLLVEVIDDPEKNNVEWLKENATKYL